VLTTSYQIGIEVLGFLFNPGLIFPAVAIWLLIATGVVGRVVHYFEELPHPMQPALALVPTTQQTTSCGHAACRNRTARDGEAGNPGTTRYQARGA
jgi:hypothetical protein